jgi:hypothetical protein
MYGYTHKKGISMSCPDHIVERNRKNAQVKFIDLTNCVFFRLKVIKRVFIKPKTTSWLCLCECGKETIVNAGHLKAGRIKSCGCYNKEVTSNIMKGNEYGKKHGLTNHPLRYIRKSMLHRCYNTNNRFYKNYGGKGVKVCEKWKISLEAFVDWALNNGWIKGLSIDRKDNEGDYSPENCHWITISENSKKNCIIVQLRPEKCARNNITT